MLNIVIPMAGRGGRFEKEGFTLPKPLIPVRGKAMSRLVIENIRPAREHRFVFLCLKDHLDKFGLAERLREWAPGCRILAIDQVTQGAACTVLLARALFGTTDPLLLANCDQWVDGGIEPFLNHIDEQDPDGAILTMTANDPKWSYVQFSPDGKVISVVEKQVVSDQATVGIYYFRHGSMFVHAAEKMIAADKRVAGEFYVAPVYNELIAEKARIVCWNVGSEGNGMHGLGIPSDVRAFENLSPRS